MIEPATEAVGKTPWPVCTKCGRKEEPRLTFNQAYNAGWRSLLPDKVLCPACEAKVKP